MWFFKFICTYYDDEDKKEVFVRGLTVGSRVYEAAQRVVDYFGEDNIVSLTVEALDSEDVLVMPKQLLDQVEKESR